MNPYFVIGDTMTDKTMREEKSAEATVLEDEAKDIRELVGHDVWRQFNETQLWYIFLSLDQPQLVEPLKGAQQSLANQARAYGNHYYDWGEK